MGTPFLSNLLILNNLLDDVKAASVTRYMQLNSYLVKSRHGIYYLRIQRNGTDKRVSLRTKNLAEAQFSAYQFGAKLRFMTNPKNHLGWSLDTRVDGTFSIKTDDTPEDRASAENVVRMLAEQKMASSLVASNSISQALKPISIADAVIAYLPKLTGAIKSQKMAKTALGHLVSKLGSNFNMSEFNDEIVDEQWMEIRKTEVAMTTVKKELSWINGFSAFAYKQKYCLAPLTITIAKGAAANVHRAYFDGNDLKVIFDALPSAAKHPWKFWIPVIGLYTGARIGELAGLRVEHFFTKMGLNVMHLPGTKTDCAPRDVPLHPALVSIGLLQYVESRRAAGWDMLFDIVYSTHNGYGAAPSKWFGPFLRSVGIVNKDKVFHSFRHTFVDHLKQMLSEKEVRMQFMGHADARDTHSSVYGRQDFPLTALQKEVINKIDWNQYCGWSPDVEKLRIAADAL